MKKNIIYILGAGRSGSTILGVVLGDNKGIAHVGEINKLFINDGEPPNIGKDSEVFCVYKDIIKKIMPERNKYLLKKVNDYDYHTNFVKILFGLYGGSFFHQYQKLQERLFDELFDVFGVETVIDSSKYATRCLILKKNKKYNFRVIYLHRKFAGVLKSYKKKGVEQPSRNVLWVSAYYVVIHAMSLIAYLMINKKDRVFVEYEDFMGAPIDVLKKIEGKFEINLEESKTKIKNHKKINTGAVFDGNRLRFERDILFGRKINNN